jgi:hypothetical protein
VLDGAARRRSTAALGDTVTVADPSKIDIVARRPDADVVRLVITDHLEWTAELEHLAMLQAKLNAYLAFVESGQLRTSYPDTAEKRVQIEILFVHEPTEHAQQHFLARAVDIVRGAGMELLWTVRR